ncbi:hypothetical protein KKA14_10355, partial [bacterium]|nr:hypothetical protein [bacterium]
LNSMPWLTSADEIPKVSVVFPELFRGAEIINPLLTFLINVTSNKYLPDFFPSIDFTKHSIARVIHGKSLPKTISVFKNQFFTFFDNTTHYSVSSKFK